MDRPNQNCKTIFNALILFDSFFLPSRKHGVATFGGQKQPKQAHVCLGLFRQVHVVRSVFPVLNTIATKY
jgi:hypothetical protein